MSGWLLAAGLLSAAFLGALVTWLVGQVRRARQWADAREALEARQREVVEIASETDRMIGTMTPEEVEAHAHELLERLRDRSRGGPLGPAPGGR